MSDASVIPIKPDAVNRTTDSREVRIVVCDRGHTFVGLVWHQEEWTLIDNAFVIRTVGTPSGIAELAKHGPAPKTILDACPSVFTRNVIFEMACDPVHWQRVLSPRHPT